MVDMPGHSPPASRRRGGWQIVLTLLVAGLAIAGCSRVGGAPFQPALNTPIVFGGDTPGTHAAIGQTFDAPGPISTFDVSVATFAAPPDPDGTLRATLREVGDDQTRATGTVSGAQLEDGGWAALNFTPAVDIDGVALIELTWQGQTPLALWADRTLEGTAGIVNDPYAAGQLVLDGQGVQGDLAFRVGGPAGAGQAATQLGEVAASTAARMQDQPVFTMLWALAVLGSAALAFSGRRRRHDPSGPEQGGSPPDPRDRATAQQAPATPATPTGR